MTFSSSPSRIPVRSILTQSLVSLALAAIGASCATGGSGESGRKPPSSTERAQLLLQAANASLGEGDATGALQNLLEAEKYDPTVPGIHHSKAIAFYAKHDLQTALLEAHKAVELKPDYSEANNTYGKFLMDSGRAEEAVAPLNRSANDPLYREAFKPLTNLGILYYRRGDYAKSDQYLSRAILSAPTAACVAYYYRGHLRLRDSRFQDAVGDYESAGKKACAAFADAHLAMGIALQRGKQYDLARKKFVEVSSRFPNTKVAEQAIGHLRDIP